MPTPANPTITELPVIDDELLQDRKVLPTEHDTSIGLDRDDFRERVAHAAHDLTNLVVAVTGVLAQTMERIEQCLGGIEVAEAERSNMLFGIYSDINRLRGVVSVMAKIIADLPRFNDTFEKKPLNVKTLIEEIVFAFNCLAHTNKINVKTTVICADEDCMAELDAVSIWRAIHNLYKNALEALSNTNNPEIVISVRTKDDKTLVSVKDNGPGIPKHLRNEMLHSRVSTKKRNGSGHGYGLLNVKEVTDRHSGTIIIDTGEINGTEIILEFPRGSYETANHTFVDESAEKSPQIEMLKGIPVVIVEDEALISMLYGVQLEKFGADNVAVCNNFSRFQEAVEKMEPGTEIILILDAIFPGGDTNDVVALLNEKQIVAKIIFSSGNVVNGVDMPSWASHQLDKTCIVKLLPQILMAVAAPIKEGSTLKQTAN